MKWVAESLGEAYLDRLGQCTLAISVRCTWEEIARSHSIPTVSTFVVAMIGRFSIAFQERHSLSLSESGPTKTVTVGTPCLRRVWCLSNSAPGLECELKTDHLC